MQRAYTAFHTDSVALSEGLPTKTNGQDYSWNRKTKVEIRVGSHKFIYIVGV